MEKEHTELDHEENGDQLLAMNEAFLAGVEEGINAITEDAQANLDDKVEALIEEKIDEAKEAEKPAAPLLSILN